MILLLIIIFLILRIIWQHPQHFFTHRRSVIIVSSLPSLLFSLPLPHFTWCSSPSLQTIMLFVMLAEVIAVLIRQQSHVRVTRALRPVLLIDTYLMYRVRRYCTILQSFSALVSPPFFHPLHYFLYLPPSLLSPSLSF